MKQAINILKEYITCEDPGTRNKFFNLLDSFWHKDEGKVLKQYTVAQNGDITFQFVNADGSTSSVNLPALPNSRPISFIEGLAEALDDLVTKVPGKGLSTHDLTTELLNKLNGLQNYQHPEFHQINEVEGLPEALEGKQPIAPEGWGFSQQNFSLTEKNKLAKYDELHYSAPVNDLVELAAIPMEERATKQRRYVHSEGVDYFFDASILAANAEDDFVAPDDQVNGEGFWFKSTISEISVLDENGIEQFRFKDGVRFKGVSFNAAQKTIEVIKKLKEVVVQDKSQLLGDLQSDVLYVIDGHFTLGLGESIVVPPGGLNVMGYSFDASGINSFAVDNHAIFTSPAEGSGNLIIHNIAFTCTGTGSKVFDVVDSDGSHAVELVTVNFNGCKSLGKIRNYRQGTGITIGIYGCSDGLILSGTWNGFKLTNTNCFGFAATGTLFKKDVDTVFSNRLFLELNMDLPAGAILIDFGAANFAVNDLLQFNSTILKYDGVIDDANAEIAIPNIRANNPKCLWRSNVGIPDTAIEKFVDAEVAGAYEIDWLNDTFNIVMTAATVFSDKNLPASGKSTKEIQIYLTGEFTPNFPAGWNANKVGTYKGDEVNKITLKFIKAGLYFMKIDNSLTVYPAPDLSYTVPSGLYPSQTQKLEVYGSFFTPASIVSINNGHTVESVKFINSGLLELSVSTSATEADANITISNGTQKVFNNAFVVALGEVFVPQKANWIEVSGNPNLESAGEVKLNAYNSTSYATYDKIIDVSKDFSVRYRYAYSPLGSFGGEGYNVFLIDTVTGNTITQTFPRGDVMGLNTPSGTSYPAWKGELKEVEFRYIIDPDTGNGTLYAYYDGQLLRTSGTLANNLKLRIKLVKTDVVGIKYIELAQQ